MRKAFLLTTVAIATIASMDAMAADLGVRGPVPPAPMMMAPVPPPVTWSGCYIGANIGGAFGHNSVDTPFGSASEDNSGFAGGGQVGCDWQFAGGWVVGIRNMFDGTTNHHSQTFDAGPFAGDVVDFNNHWFDTLTGRVGYSWIPTWLVYAQGGVAWAHTDTSITTPGGLELLDTTTTRTGWTLGGGVEWMFYPHWSAFLEGNYMDFGSESHTLLTPVGVSSFDTHPTATNVLVGVNYRFW